MVVLNVIRVTGSLAITGKVVHLRCKGPPRTASVFQFTTANTAHILSLQGVTMNITGLMRATFWDFNGLGGDIVISSGQRFTATSWRRIDRSFRTTELSSAGSLAAGGRHLTEHSLWFIGSLCRRGRCLMVDQPSPCLEWPWLASAWSDFAGPHAKLNR